MIPNHFDTLQWTSRRMAITIEQVEQNKGRYACSLYVRYVLAEVFVSISNLLQFRFQFHLKQDLPLTSTNHDYVCLCLYTCTCVCVCMCRYRYDLCGIRISFYIACSQSSFSHSASIEILLLNGAIYLIIWQSHRWHFYAVFDSTSSCGYKRCAMRPRFWWRTGLLYHHRLRLLLNVRGYFRHSWYIINGCLLFAIRVNMANMAFFIALHCATPDMLRVWNNALCLKLIYKKKKKKQIEMRHRLLRLREQA